MRPPPFGSDHHHHHQVPTSSPLEVPFFKPVTTSPASLGFGFVPKPVPTPSALFAAGPSRRGPNMTFGGPVAAGLRVTPAAGRKRRSPSPIEVDGASSSEPVQKRAFKKIRGGTAEPGAKSEVDVGKSLGLSPRHLGSCTLS